MRKITTSYKKQESPPSAPLRVRALSMAKVIGQNIKAKRTSLGLTQAEIGDLVNLSYQQIQKYETGISIISAVQLYDLSIQLNVPVSNFYNGLQIPKGKLYPEVPNENETISAREVANIQEAFGLIKDKKLRYLLLQTARQIAKED